jgi:hypothetical protein
MVETHSGGDGVDGAGEDAADGGSPRDDEDDDNSIARPTTSRKSHTHSPEMLQKLLLVLCIHPGAFPRPLPRQSDGESAAGRAPGGCRVPP